MAGIADALDVLNGTIRDLDDDLVFNFVNYPVVHEELIKSGAKRPWKGGTYREYPFTTGGAGRAKGIFGGSEILPKTRAQRHQKLQYETHRIVHTLHIPNRELTKNRGPLAIIELIDAYPKQDMAALIQDIEDYILTGASGNRVISTTDLAGLGTLNGEFASGSLTGVTDGFLDFVVPASQGGSVGNFTKSSANFHYNQYGLISSWPTDGLKTLKRVLRTCAKWGMHKDARSYFMVMDDVTFGNFEDERASRVRVDLVSDDTEKDVTFDLSLMGARVHHSLHLDTTAFSGTGSNGVTYILDTDNFEIIVAEELALGEFKDSEDQDVVYMKMPWEIQNCIKRLPAHGVVAGGN